MFSPQKKAIEARSILLWLLYEVGEGTHVEIGKYFGMDDSTVWHAINEIEHTPDRLMAARVTLADLLTD
jgi:chromosomal replication initiation ATPase DnaA